MYVLYIFNRRSSKVPEVRPLGHRGGAAMRQPSAGRPQPSARHVLPEFTERTSRGFRTMDPYSKLLSERVILLGAPIDDTSANDVMAQLVHLEYAAPDQDIQLYINSPGGSYTAMTALYDTMQYVGCDIQT